MNKYITSIAILLTMGFCNISCIEETPSYFEFEDYSFSELDENGGLMNTFLLVEIEEIALEAPQTSRVQELDDIKLLMSSMTKQETKAVEYWTSNPIIRWNEIALELAAKYNLIPGPNEDGTYTLPNPANPQGPPVFPFAHPPYTSRALAYLSVAQFDGLVAAWHYKYKFKLNSPYQEDSGIIPAYSKNNLPSFPSDGAVVAKVSKDILSAMFPLEREFLEGLFQEHLKSMLQAGINFRSDLDAGELIGSEISKIALQRASTDGMSKAQTPKSVSDSIKNAAFERFGWAWENMESPKRPVGLTPLFGKVKMWNVSNVEEVRPGPPPAPGSDQFNKDAEELKRFANNLTVEQRKIANWWQDGLGTYTPPGHWNKFAKEAIVKNKLNPLRSAKVFAYMNTAIVDAGISCWDAKYYYHYPRPIQTIPGFKTILGTPNFPAYTSGHSTFSAAGAVVLSYFFPEDQSMFNKYAEEAAMSRVYGGIHYRFDAEVGIEQGRNIGNYAVEKAKNDRIQ
ncbi:phosphatase PAP2 family protein [Belliella marina]|uniref:Phosphatase PAP2 family protein n=1 Tax=Belliella marina TaxID=1644146 RepID=A0ABW4VN09_9BACT